MFKYIKLGLLLSLVSLFFVSNSFSQQNKVKLEGWVTDQQGNPAGNATLLAANVDTGYSAKSVTDNQGRYVFRNMPPGRYKIKLVGEGGRGGDITVDAEILPGYDYMLRFSDWQKGELVPFIREGEVKFVVTDRKGKPIPNAEIRLNQNYYYPIDASGIATYSFKPGLLTFVITASNYKSQTKRVELKPDDSITLTFRLKKGR
jgi:Carboxypeptidase regulatory-like domain